MLQKLAAKSVSIAIYLAKTFKKSEALAAAGTLFITQIAPGDSNVGFRQLRCMLRDRSYTSRWGLERL